MKIAIDRLDSALERLTRLITIAHDQRDWGMQVLADNAKQDVEEAKRLITNSEDRTRW